MAGNGHGGDIHVHVTGSVFTEHDPAEFIARAKKDGMLGY
jgi:hypothetical protein